MGTRTLTGNRCESFTSLAVTSPIHPLAVSLCVYVSSICVFVRSRSHLPPAGVAFVMDGLSQKAKELGQSITGKAKAIYKAPSEMMAGGVWNACAENVGKQFAIGATAGLALSLVLFRKCVICSATTCDVIEYC